MVRSESLFAALVVVTVGILLVSSGAASLPGSATGTPTETAPSSTSTSVVPSAGGPTSSVTSVGIGGREAAAYFNPAVVTVVIGVNNTVVWYNGDTAIHTVTSTTFTASGKPLFDSGDMGPAAEFTYTFSTPGTYPYICIYHGDMVGTVIVKPAKA